MSATVDQKPSGCLAIFFNLFRSSSQSTERQVPPETSSPRITDGLPSPHQATFFHVRPGVSTRSSISNSSVAEPLPYRIRSNFLSPAELSFYHVLRSVIGDQVTISAKVRLADIFFVPQSHDRYAYQNRINQKHLDFILCDPKTMQPIVGIELDDRSHQRPDRAERDAFVDAVFVAANLPLLHVLAKHTYSLQEVEALIMPHTLEQAPTPQAPIAMPLSEAATPPICSTCKIPMVIRTSKRGEFFGCRNYPQCRVTAPI